MLKRLLAPLSRQADPVRAASATMPERARMLRARFDSAQTTADNRRHWAAADGLSPNAAVSPEVRRILRNRARYEVANNSYAKGIVLTLANDTIGTGPRLQMLTPDSSVNARVEEAFEVWSAAIDLPGKLRSMRMARAESGEAFGLLISSPGLDTPVKLDLRLLEPDQVCTPWFGRMPTGQAVTDVDGIVFDASGLPVAYHVLRHHPGDGAWHAVRDHDTYPAASVLHYFRPDRPGQWRGIPDITPALPLFAQLRRYTLAVIAAAETAADFAAVLYTDAPANGEADPLEPMDEVELEKRMATVLPGGWKLGQVHAEHPSTTYGEFKREILNEIARCLNMPFNVAAGNSSGYNYASGRLDHQTYFKSIRVEQHRLQQTVLDRLIRAWLDEAALVEGLLPQAMRVRGAATPHVWFWDGVEHVDDLPTLNTRVTRARAVMMQAWIDAAEEGRAEAVEQIRPEVREQARLLEIERALHQSEMQRRQAERALERARLQDESVSMREDHELARIRLELQREATTNRQRELDYESQTKILEELTEENRRLREQLHEQEMRRSRDVSRATSDETRRLLEPVLALGTWQPGLRNPNPAGPMLPMSYGALLRSGALEPDENGLRNLMAIVNGRGVNWQGAMQTMHGQGNRRRHLDSMRPKLGFPARFNDLTTAQADHLWRMQKKLIELGPTLVELEMLAL